MEESNLNAMLKGTLYSIPIMSNKRVKELQYYLKTGSNKWILLKLLNAALNYLGFLLSMDFPYTLLLSLV